jgi:hypothetical protein
VHQPAPAAKRKSSWQVTVPGDRYEQEADRAAEAVVRGESPQAVRKSAPVTLMRASDGDRVAGVDANKVDPVLRSSGQRLGDETRSLMEDRLGFDFSRVRVHTDAEAARSARAVGARAYTVGADIVFGAGEYAPRSREGQRLIAHELTHVRQQAFTPPMLQRWGILDEIAGWFAGDSFDQKTLTKYIGDLDSKGPEDHSDSDNKARAVVAAWKKDRKAFNLTPKLKALLVREMQAGFCGTDDELAILDLLTTAEDSELRQMFTTGKLSAKDLESAFHFAEDDKLMAFFAARFEGGFERLKEGKVVVKSRGGAPTGKTAPAGKAAPEKPRQDYIFIMGNTRGDEFYRQAARYFRLHYPNAELITTERTLDGVLSYIDRNVQVPIGNLYVVSHGNEDGTLSFGLDDADMVRDPKNPRSLRGDSRLSPMELRDALNPPGGKSTLRDVSSKIDAKTVIRIRGCSLGQNKEFVNLIDAAFGGKGRVIASTHEQRYGTDPVLAQQARARKREAIEASEPMPTPLKAGASRADRMAREKALKERRARINQKLSDQKQDIEEAAAVAGSWEAMSGVVMQRPGTAKFSQTEVTAEIERRYQHLGKRQRAGLIARVLGTQRVETLKFGYFSAIVPSDSRQALSMFGPSLRKESFVPDVRKKVDIEPIKQKGGMETMKYTFHDADGRSVDVTIEDIPANDDMILREAQRDSPNPQNYEWEVKRTRAGARLSISAVATRVFADLHHQSLDVSPHEPFAPGEENPIFYVKSTYEPKDPAKQAGKKDDRKK